MVAVFGREVWGHVPLGFVSGHSAGVATCCSLNGIGLGSEVGSGLFSPYSDSEHA